MIALCMPEVARCVTVIDTSLSPTSARPASYSANEARRRCSPYTSRARPDRRRKLVVRDDVADPDSTSGPQDPGDLAEDGGLVGRQVDHAVADDDVDRVGRHRDGLDVALQEFDVRGAGFSRVARGQREHLVRHVEPERPTGGSDSLRREEDVDPAAGAEVEDALALVQFGDRIGLPHPSDARTAALGSSPRSVSL